MSAQVVPEGVDGDAPYHNFVSKEGKKFRFSEKSLWYLEITHPFRVFALNVITMPMFENFILGCIVVNALVMAGTDYSHVVTDEDAYGYGEPDASCGEECWRNKVALILDYVFVVIFTVEMGLKIIGMGFYSWRPQGTYLEDAWNKLDFVVVVTSLLEMMRLPGMPSISALRMCRVLRPLKSLNAIPQLQNIVVAMLKSIPGLISVIIVLLFMMLVFGIAGINLFAGSMQQRCRLTPFPVNQNWTTGDDPLQYACLLDRVDMDEVQTDDELWSALTKLNVALSDDILESELVNKWRKSTSPWRDPKDCTWPLDPDDGRLCSLTSDDGHRCYGASSWTASEEKDGPFYPIDWWGFKMTNGESGDARYCGSNFDFFGNARFQKVSDVILTNPTKDPDLYSEDYAYGYTTFDHLGLAMLTIFQSITQEGWSDVMNLCMDCTTGYEGAFYFLLLTLCGAFWSLNLLLAALEDSFEHEDEEGEEEEDEAAVAAAEGGDDAKSVRSAVTDAASQVTEEDARSLIKFDRDQLERAREWVSDPDGTFSLIIMVLIVANTLVLMMDRNGASEGYTLGLEIAGFVLTILFTIEMLLKLSLEGVTEYAKDVFNRFDFVIVCLSLIEILLSPPGFMSSGNSTFAVSGLSSIRSFRVFRIFKLARKWKTMHKLLTLIWMTLLDVSYFLLLVVLFIFIFTLGGMQFFANRMRFYEDSGYRIKIGDPGWNSQYTLDYLRPRSHFDSFPWGFVTIFQILSGENWNAVMYDGIRASGETGRGNMMASVYFVALVIIMALVIFNLFIALLLGNLEALSTGADEEEEKVVEEEPEEEESVAEEEEMWNSGTAKVASVTKLKHVTVTQKDPLKLDDISQILSRRATQMAKGSFRQKLKKLPDYFDMEKLAAEVDRRERIARAYPQEYGEKSIFPLTRGKAIGLFPHDSRIRIVAALVVEHRFFDRGVLFLILVSSVLLAIDSPLLNPDSNLKKCLDTFDAVMTVLFTIEMTIKVVAMGFITMDKSYLRSNWNKLDFFVVIVSLVNLSAGDSAKWFSTLKVFRTIRAFRPLRMINRAPGLKVIVNAMLAAIPGVLNVLFVIALMLLIFAIFAVQNFKGLMYRCSDTDDNGHFMSVLQGSPVEDVLLNPKAWDDLSLSVKELFGPQSTYFANSTMDTAFYQANSNYTEWLQDPIPLCRQWYGHNDDFNEKRIPTGKDICGCMGAAWDKPVPQSFDHIGVAMLSLFELMTTEGWVDVLYELCDSRGIGGTDWERDQQPIRDSNMWLPIIYFVVFIFLFNFLFLNLFVGVVIDNFNALKDQADGKDQAFALLTPSQQRWVMTQEVLIKINPTKVIKRPPELIAGLCYDLTSHPGFEWAIMVCIIVNTTVMACEFFGQSDEWTKASEALNLVFAVIFTIEAAMKLSGQGQAYFNDNWNKFDITIVFVTWIGVAADHGTLGSLVRTFRVGRAFRLVHGMKDIKRIFNTLLLTLPGLANIAALLLLFLFIYSVVGVQVFAKVALNGANDEHTNLRYFFRSFLILIKFSTGENWNGFMHDLTSNVDGCINVDNLEYDTRYCGFSNSQDCEPLPGCGEPLKFMMYAYMVTFNFIVAFVFLNLFIGVILDGFSNSNEAEHAVTEEDFEWFKSVWQREEFDPDATCYLTVDKLLDFAVVLICENKNTSFARLRHYWGFGSMSNPVTTRARRHFSKFREPLKIFENQGVHFKHVLDSFCKDVVKVQLSTHDEVEEIENIPRDTQQHLLKTMNVNYGHYLKGFDYNILLRDDGTVVTVKHDNAARTLKSALVGWRVRKSSRPVSRESLRSAGGTRKAPMRTVGCQTDASFDPEDEATLATLPHSPQPTSQTLTLDAPGAGGAANTGSLFERRYPSDKNRFRQSQNPNSKEAHTPFFTSPPREARPETFLSTDGSESNVEFGVSDAEEAREDPELHEDSLL